MGKHHQPVYPPIFPGGAGADGAPLRPGKTCAYLAHTVWLRQPHHSVYAVPSLVLSQGVSSLGGTPSPLSTLNLKAGINRLIMLVKGPSGTPILPSIIFRCANMLQTSQTCTKAASGKEPGCLILPCGNHP
jgi:hypothetical protein